MLYLHNLLKGKIIKNKCNMTIFSERHGYTKGSDELIRKEITRPINNSILNWFSEIEEHFRGSYYAIEKEIWQYFLEEKLIKYQHNRDFRTIVIINYLEDVSNSWFQKLNLIEFFLSRFKNITTTDNYFEIIERLNNEFERLNFAYRIIGNKVEELTSKIEIDAIEEALDNEHKGVKTHLQDALAFLSVTHETPSYRSSIHQSISAVEACCRAITNESTLGRALNKLENSGVKINKELQKGFSEIYYYTNGVDGIRHALMDDSNPPTADEAIFMLVSCSAFINYLTKKKNQK